MLLALHPTLFSECCSWPSQLQGWVGHLVSGYWPWTKPTPCLSIHMKSYGKKTALLVFSLPLVLSRHKMTLESGEDHMTTKAQE